MANTPLARRFSLGRTVSTRNALNNLHPQDILAALARHASGDWGLVDAHDKKMNDDALASGEDRLFSVYMGANSVKFYIVTEWDHSVTTVLLPEDY